jgi:UDP:flavonoid glycosyltransferase YjiC (YdhE family)
MPYPILTGRKTHGNGELRLLLGAFGEPGHAFPMIALGERLVQRGHDVTIQTWVKWRDHAERAGMRFSPAPEYQVFPTRGRPLKPYQAAVRAARDSGPLVTDVRPDAAVADILTLAPALAAELEGVPVATLVPHVFPPGAPGFPPYSLGARHPRTPAGRAFWRGVERYVRGGLRQGRTELNGARARLGLPPLTEVHGGISRQLCLVATFPQLEYPRAWPPWAHVAGPLLWEPPADAVDLPEGEGPLVLVAPSTSQDRSHRLLRAALEGLAGEPVRVLAAWNKPGMRTDLDLAPNVRLVDWVSYSRTMPRSDLVVCHGGHGTVVRALACGCPLVVAPIAGDMNENAARVDWAGVGVRVPWRLVGPRTLRLAVRRALEERAIGRRARALAAWSAANDGADRACELVEGFARRPVG